MIAPLQEALQQHADPARRAWWTRYLKGTAAFRGVTMQQVRAEVRAWVAQGAGPAEPPAQVEAALALLAEPLTEDKLAGVLLLTEHVLPTGAISSAVLLPRLAEVFDAGHLADWNSVDWLSVKALAGWLGREGPPCASRLVGWADAPVLWRRRAAAVAFVPLAPHAPRHFPGFADALIEICTQNVQDPARFSQTSVGWALRELSKAAPDRVEAFLARWEAQMSAEARKAARKHLSA